MRLGVVFFLLLGVGYTAAAARPPVDKPTVTAAQKRPGMELKNTVKCSDGETHCTDGQTCCKLTSGEYGCCPYPNATCCSDGDHCCPGGYSCDLKAGTCENRATSESLPMLLKQPARALSYCYDGYTYCFSDETCCPLDSSWYPEYGCCPYQSASCCSDYVHCCPQGYTCIYDQCYG